MLFATNPLRRIKRKYYMTEEESDEYVKKRKKKSDKFLKDLKNTTPTEEQHAKTTKT